MTQINAIKSAILSTIRKGDYKFPFRDLECSTRLTFEELSSVIGLLIKEEKILGLPEFGVMGIANGILTIYTPYV